MTAMPDQRPEVSVVLITYRARDLALRCLESLRDNVTIAHEAIVVDDGSGDGTAEAVREGFPEARVLAKERNEGLVAGRNSALKLIQGRFVLMLDSDTEIRPGAVATPRWGWWHPSSSTRVARSNCPAGDFRPSWHR